jgi:hypothetical protein
MEKMIEPREPSWKKIEMEKVLAETDDQITEMTSLGETMKIRDTIDEVTGETTDVTTGTMEEDIETTGENGRDTRTRPAETTEEDIVMTEMVEEIDTEMTEMIAKDVQATIGEEAEKRIEITAVEETPEIALLRHQLGTTTRLSTRSTMAL